MSNNEEEESLLIVKCSIKRFFKNNNSLIERIQKYVEQLNRIITEAYHLFNLHIRRLLEQNLSIPNLTRTWMNGFFYAVSSLNGKDESLGKDPELLKTYNNEYLPLIHAAFGNGYTKPDRKNLADAIGYACEEMLTCVHNNIRIHFIKRQWKYLRITNPDAKKDELFQKLKELNEKSHWQPDVAYLPSSIDESVYKDLQTNPVKFLRPMYHMNIYLEQQGKKTFALLPVRHGFIPKNCRITTRDFQKILKELNLSVNTVLKKDEKVLTTEQIFIAYKTNTVCNQSYYMHNSNHTVDSQSK